MEELRVLGVEDGDLVVAGVDGVRYKVVLDPVVRAQLRHSPVDAGDARRLAPRDIQAQIRAGLSAEEVARLTGASLDYIQRFEGPVLAERAFVIDSALGVPVRSADADPLVANPTFGDAIRQRLADAGAAHERWASWKEQGGGWVLKLAFRIGEVEHDARWSYDAKRQALAPLNTEAQSLSTEGEVPAVLVPRLRAVPDRPAEPSRFDSGAFVTRDEGDDTGPLLEPVPYGRSSDAPGAADDADSPTPTAEITPISDAVASAPPAPAPVRGPQQTADLLEALRRRRGERDPMNPDLEESIASHPSTGSVRLVDVPLEPADPPVGSRGRDTTSSSSDASADRRSTGSVTPLGGKARKGRASMPSWDDIVFGARPDDD